MEMVTDDDGGNGEADEDDLELVDEELTEVLRCADELTAQAAIEEVLGPAGIPAMLHNRVSHAFPAPATLAGAYFVAVPVGQAVQAALLLREAQNDGALPAEAEVAQIA
jgi:hypothetical protein